MGVNTANFGFRKPTVGGDDDAWGNDYAGLPRDVKGEDSPGLNGNWELLDQEFAENEALIAALEAEVGTLPSDLDALVIPIGGLYVSVTDDDPATTIGYGTWEAWGEGRALVGVGNNGESDWTADQERGVAEHTLTEAELPVHSHDTEEVSVGSASAGAHSHNYSGTTTTSGNIRGGSFGASKRSQATSTTPAHTHDLNVPPFDTAEVGGGAAHSNEQPGTAVYIWKRLT